MSIKESALTTITSIAQSDYVRAVTSAGGSRKLTVANLAKTVLEAYVIHSEAITITIGTTSATNTAQRVSGVVTLPIVLTNSSGFTGFTSGTTVATLPVGYRPTTARYGTIIARDNGVWASANYAHIVVNVNSDGTVKLYGNETSIRAMKYINGLFTYIASAT